MSKELEMALSCLNTIRWIVHHSKRKQIMAYIYERDYHCVDCTLKQFKVLPIFQQQDWEGQIPLKIEDSEGDFVTPVSHDTEWQNFDYGYIEDNPIQILKCVSCHEEIDRWKESSISDETKEIRKILKEASS